MHFIERLRPGIRDGSITCSIRIWQRPHVRVGGIYAMEEGHILVQGMRQIALADVTGDLARQSGFLGVVDLLKTARHGSGEKVWLIEFEYLPPAV